MDEFTIMAGQVAIEPTEDLAPPARSQVSTASSMKIQLSSGASVDNRGTLAPDGVAAVSSSQPSHDGRPGTVLEGATHVVRAETARV